MKLNVLVPEVATCGAEGCAYNVDRNCHAKAITIGDGTHPQCDTFMPQRDHTHATGKGGVGACKVSACRYNRDFECEAESIRVDHHGDHADCITFAP